jgi:hypothetical protein
LYPLISVQLVFSLREGFLERLQVPRLLEHLLHVLQRVEVATVRESLVENLPDTIAHHLCVHVPM